MFLLFPVVPAIPVECYYTVVFFSLFFSFFLFFIFLLFSFLPFGSLLLGNFLPERDKTTHLQWSLNAKLMRQKHRYGTRLCWQRDGSTQPEPRATQTSPSCSRLANACSGSFGAVSSFEIQVLFFLGPRWIWLVLR